MDMMTIALLTAGLALLVLGAELLVRGASRKAVSAGVSQLVIGLTVVSYGTSTPELAVSLQAGLAGNTDIAVANQAVPRPTRRPRQRAGSGWFHSIGPLQRS